MQRTSNPFYVGSSPAGGANCYGECSSMVERQIVDLEVGGSKPLTHPNIVSFAPVAQLDRATDFESVG
jgi:hypothetical protein